MLCRALLAAVVLSYVLCVLLLSGVQKEDIDASTLRKLQRHNVNIDDINDQELRKQCLGKTNIPITVLTQDNPVTEKATTEKSITAKEITIQKHNVGSQAEDRGKLRKIFEFLEYERKGKKNKAFKSNASILRPTPNSNKPNFYFSNRNHNKNIEDSDSETSELRGTSVTDKEDDRANKATMNKKLKSLMNIWQTNEDNILNKKTETTTAKTIKEYTLSKNTKDVEYITKIVEEIMTKKKINDFVASNMDQKPHYDSNATVREVDETPDAKSKNKTYSPTNYFLNNCKVGNFYANTKGDEDRYEINLDKQVEDDFNLPYKKEKNTDNYVICKKVEPKKKKMLNDRIHDPEINNILSNLIKKSEYFKLPDNDSSIPTSRNGDVNEQNGVETVNKKDFLVLDNEIITVLKNQTESVINNEQNDRIKTKDNYKDRLVLLDPETAKALEDALETQSNIYNQIFIRQRDLAQLSKTDRARITMLENDRRKELQSVLIEHPPTLQYKPSQQNESENKKYNMWRYANQHTIRSQIQTMEPRENNVIYNIEGNNIEKSTDNVIYDTKLDIQYKRPWFYSEGSSGQLRNEIKKNRNGVFFKPNDKNGSHKNTIGKKWSPYFDNLNKNFSTSETGEKKRPESQKPIRTDSYKYIQYNAREISQELSDHSKKNSDFVQLNQNRNVYPNVIDTLSGEIFETKKRKKISEARCQTIHETRIKCVPEADYKIDNNREYFRNQPIENHVTNIQEPNEESEYFNYQFPSRPKMIKHHYETYIAGDDFVHKNETKESVKLPLFPQNVIKDIANSIKEIVLKDLITTTIIPPTTATPSTTTSSLTTSTATTTTTTPKTTITTTKTTNKPTEGASTAETKQPFKIQDASKALEKIMEMFEKMSSIKDKFVNQNVTYRGDDRYDPKMETTTQITQNRQEQPAQQQTESRLPYNIQSLQPNLENQPPYVPQPFQSNPEQRGPYQQQPLQYIPQALQMRANSSNPYVLPAMQQREAISQLLQSNQESRTAENRVPYDPQNLQRNPENPRPYLSPALQLKTENRMPYASYAVPMKSEIPSPYEPQPAQLKLEKENNLPYDPQSKLDNRSPYFPAAVKMRAEHRLPYLPQAVQLNTENNLPRDPHSVLNKKENLTPYFPKAVQSKVENRVPYNTQPLQRSPDNRVPYDTLTLQSNLGIGIPYDAQPLKTNPRNSASYLPQPLPYPSNDVQQKTANGVPYDLQPLQRNQKIPYTMNNPFYNSKIELDPYQDKEVLEPIRQKPKPRKYAITVQTNSGEIAPLKIAVQKPVPQTIVLTTKSPEKVEQHSEKTFNDRRLKSISTRHEAEKSKESEISNKRDNNKYYSRHTHRDTYIEHPKSRKIKEHEEPQQHRSRDLQEIARFHEKLERGDDWNQYREERIAKRIQRPIVKNTNYDDTHFRNFLQTQQKVNAMLERILATSKNKPISTEVV